MAPSATLLRFAIQLADSDRGVYESLDLRVAQHPSENLRFLLTRLLGLCLYYEEGIGFSRGLSTTDEPAVWVKSDDGRIRLWLDVGHPTAERLHRASKIADRVVVCSHDGIEPVRRAVGGARVHRAEEVEIVGIPRSLLDALEGVTERNMSWEITHSGSVLYVVAGGASFEGAVERGHLVESGAE